MSAKALVWAAVVILAAVCLAQAIAAKDNWRTAIAVALIVWGACALFETIHEGKQP